MPNLSLLDLATTVGAFVFGLGLGTLVHCAVWELRRHLWWVAVGLGLASAAGLLALIWAAVRAEAAGGAFVFLGYSPVIAFGLALLTFIAIAAARHAALVRRPRWQAAAPLLLEVGLLLFLCGRGLWQGRPTSQPLAAGALLAWAALAAWRKTPRAAEHR